MTQRYNPDYRTLTKSEYELLTTIKAQASELSEVILGSVPAGHRERYIALTKLDECVMWATKGITR